MRWKWKYKDGAVLKGGSGGKKKKISTRALDEESVTTEAQTSSGQESGGVKYNTNSVNQQK